MTQWKLQRGAEVVPDGVRFRVWAPRCEAVDVRLVDTSRDVPMARDAHGVFEVTVSGAGAGREYLYVLDHGDARPDPVSRGQNRGVHGPSCVVDPNAFTWSDQGWRGLALEAHVMYELHVGTFTPGGTFDDVIPRLRELKRLGVTAVELMPVAQCPGARNWGYDGVQLYAPQANYGGPEGLKRLVDACHREGLAVVLDVVYNHIGPEGNYLAAFGPYFTDRYCTPWGDAVNFDGPGSDPVRRFFVDNALYWIDEYHVDALRLDAIHGIFDFSARHILEQMSAEVRAYAKRRGRQVWLIAESDLNDVRIINPPELGGYGIDAQWSDDFHHALHTLVTGQTRGYFADFGSSADLAKAIERGFVYDGKWSAHRGRTHGNSAASRPGQQFVIFTTNHDQVANGCGGDRISTLASAAAQKLSAAVLMCAPNLPLLFMGQEYGETAPFLYFTSHGDPGLVEAVRRGRREEFSSFGPDREFPDPQDEATFLRSKLDWSLRDKPGHAEILAFYRGLLALRTKQPCLAELRKDRTRAVTDDTSRWLTVERGDPAGQQALCLFNFHPEPHSVPIPQPGGRWRLALSSVQPPYGDDGGAQVPPAKLDAGIREVSLPGHSATIYLRGQP